MASHGESSIKSLVQQAEIKAALAVEAVALGTYELDYNTNSLTTSPRFDVIFQKTSGMTRGELSSRLHADDFAIRDAAHRKALETGKIEYESRIVWDDQSIHWIKVRGQVVYTDDGKPEKLIGVVQDITESKENANRLSALVAERTKELGEKNKALQASEERYHNMIAEVEDYAILSLDKNGIIQNWNKGAEKIKGYKEEEIVGKSFKEFYLPEDRQKQLPESLMDLAVKTGKAVQEGWRLRKDRTTFWGSIVITALHSKTGDVIGFSKVTRDLTAKKIAEDKIQRYTRELEMQNKELKQFAFIASHDMKEPLRKIMFNNDRLTESMGERMTEKERTIFSRSTAAATRMKTLIDDILSYSQTAFDTHQFQTVKLAEVLSDVVKEIKEDRNDIDIRFEADALPTINGIPHQLFQLFDNLLNNALKYSEPTRQPEIRVASATVSGTEISEELAPNSFLKISIADNGIGFDADQAEKIFSLFYRLNDAPAAAGSGIGLAICRKIVQNHKGYIKAESEHKQGATFSVYLPKDAVLSA